MLTRDQHFQSLFAVLLLAGGWIVVTNAHSRSPETDLAAPGAQLYEAAVTESVETLKSSGQANAGTESIPPSPGPDSYWCKNCKTYHKRPDPASAGRPRAAAAVSIPPSPGPDYYWCEKCKAYHKREAAPHQPDAAAPEADARPPSPGKDYSWCKKCNTYHLMKPAAQQKGTSPAVPHTHTHPPAAGPAAGQAQSGDYYYCESCKTYHRRQSPLQQPAGSSSVTGSITNQLQGNSLTNPTAIER